MHSAILLTFIKLLFVIKSFVLSIFEWPFTHVLLYCHTSLVRAEKDTAHVFQFMRTYYIGLCDKYQNLMCWHICFRLNLHDNNGHYSSSSVGMVHKSLRASFGSKFYSVCPTVTLTSESSVLKPNKFFIIIQAQSDIC